MILPDPPRESQRRYHDRLVEEITREEREASFDRALARLRRSFDDALPDGQLSLEREQRPER